jgi:hypothetical protein
VRYRYAPIVRNRAVPAHRCPPVPLFLSTWPRVRRLLLAGSAEIDAGRRVGQASQRGFCLERDHE